VIRVNNLRVNNSRVNNARVYFLRVNNARVNNARVNNLRVNNARVNNARVNNPRLFRFKNYLLLLFVMVRAFIYLISFKDTNDIYIGKTLLYNIFERLRRHKADSCCVVSSYVRNKLNNDWSNVYIDVIDTIDMKEDLTHLLNHPLNTFICPDLKKYTRGRNTNKDLLNYRLAYTEYFHIHNYNNDDKYNVINKKITNGYDVYPVYKFLYYQK
jgi:hypothetical protein